MAISSQSPYMTQGLPPSELTAVVTREVYIQEPMTKRNMSQLAFSIAVQVSMISSMSKSGSSGTMISISGSAPKVRRATSM